MRTPKRRSESAVIEQLFREPWRFDFFQAVQVLELWLRRRGKPAHGLVADMLRRIRRGRVRADIAEELDAEERAAEERAAEEQAAEEQDARQRTADTDSAAQDDASDQGPPRGE